MFEIEDLKQTRYFQDVANEAEEKGRLEGARESVLEVLKERFIRVESEVEQIINGIEEQPLLKQLLRRAVTIRDMEEFEYVLRRVSANLLSTDATDK